MPTLSPHGTNSELARFRANIRPTFRLWLDIGPRLDSSQTTSGRPNFGPTCQVTDFALTLGRIGQLWANFMHAHFNPTLGQLWPDLAFVNLLVISAFCHVQWHAMCILIILTRQGGIIPAMWNSCCGAGYWHYDLLILKLPTSCPL